MIVCLSVYMYVCANHLIWRIDLESVEGDTCVTKIMIYDKVFDFQVSCYFRNALENLQELRS